MKYQCEKNGEICDTQKPCPEVIYAGGILCGGCGRRRKAVNYIRADLVQEVNKDIKLFGGKIMKAEKL